MDLGLNGRTAIVTGASRGIGLAVTRSLVAEGVHVTAGARKSSAELAELARTDKVRVVEVDLAEPGGRPRWLRRRATGSTSWSTTSVPLRPGLAGSARSPRRTGRSRSLLT
jgi:NAD(P)-dependent dehydrogenase (short-subunit alcohol dehydrogenase family)